MSTLVLDTNIVSFLMKGHPLAASYQPHLNGNALAISFMTVAELYASPLDPADFQGIPGLKIVTMAT